MISTSILVTPRLLEHQPLPASTGSPPPELIPTTPILQRVQPKILEYFQQYGHPNIPLGTAEGRQCNALRRLKVQQKLAPEEEAWLEGMGFTWHSYEDVYQQGDFDELFAKLMEYEARHPGSNFQIPKKCKEDPELGAWVTGIRRLGEQGVVADHRDRLNAVGFAWKSARKCGSQFMGRWRALRDRIEKEGLDAVLQDPRTMPWLKLQQEALEQKAMSHTREHYMVQLFGENWTSIGK
eukprot:Nitzschia sp. Nitz4//scaffold6_size259037//127683//128396//NITZ4_001076-RA/size259037-processed-gene-0.74-mRNA-1//-1//CDS//3329556899//8539//frame0